MNLWLEKSYPAIAAMAAGPAFYFLHRGHPLPPTTKEILGAVATLAGIAIGFLAAAKSILLSIEKRRILEQLKATGHDKVFFGYMMGAVNAAFLLAFASTAGLLVNPSDLTRLICGLAAGWVALVVFAMLCYYRVIRVFFDLLTADE